jgi:hypothetical protein
MEKQMTDACQTGSKRQGKREPAAAVQAEHPEAGPCTLQMPHLAQGPPR